MSSPVVVHGAIPSTCTQVVLAALYEKDVPYKVEPVNIAKGEQLTEKHKKLQPWGKIPALVDGDFTLYESRAIASYIALKYADQGNKTLIPTELKQRAIYEQWLSIDKSYISTPIITIVSQRIFSKFRGQTCDEKAVENAAAELKKALVTFNTLMEGKQYVAGDQFTLADLFYLPYLQLLSQTPEWSLIKEQANVLAWWERISSRPSWKKVQEQVQQFWAQLEQHKN